MRYPWYPRGIAALFVAVALVFSSVAGGSYGAQAQGSPAIGSVEVDVSRLRAKGLGGFADLLGDAVEYELREYYPNAPSGARLVVSLESVLMTGSAGGDISSFSDGFSGFTPQDWLSGTNYLVGGDGQIIETYPLNVSSPASFAGPTHLPLERERAVILGQTYAQWLARRF